MAQVIVVTSGKGGVGKTTTSAAFATGLAQRGKRTVVIDFDVGLRNLDLIMGVERRVVFDIVNVIQGEAKLNQALIRDKRVDTLSILPASQTRDKDALTREGVQTIIDELSEDFDYILCDSPAGIEKGALLALYFADQALIVTNPEVSSVRDSDRILGVLQSQVEARGGEAGQGEGAPARHPLRPAARRARRDAEARRRARDPGDPAARRGAGERERAQGVQHRHAGDHGRARASPAKPTRTRSAASSARSCRTASWSRSAAAGCSSACSGGGPPDELARLLLPPQGRAGRAAPASASQAKERLQIVLAHERIGRTREDFLPKLQQELVAVVARYVAIDPGKVNINLDRGGELSTLAIEIELPGPKPAVGMQRAAAG